MDTNCCSSEGGLLWWVCRSKGDVNGVLTPHISYQTIAGVKQNQIRVRWIKPALSLNELLLYLGWNQFKMHIKWLKAWIIIIFFLNQWFYTSSWWLCWYNIFSALHFFSSLSFGKNGRVSGPRFKEWSSLMISGLCREWKANPVSSGCDRCFQNSFAVFHWWLCRPRQQKFSHSARFCCSHSSVLTMGHG